MKLYEATEALGIIDELLEESGGELTPEIEELLAHAEGSFEEKAVRVALKVRELLGAAAVCAGNAKSIKAAVAEEVGRLERRAASHESSANGLMAYLDREMTKAHRRAKPIKHELVNIQYDKLPDKIEVDEKNVSLEALCEAGFPYVSPRIEFDLDKKRLLADCKAALAANTDTKLPKGVTFLHGRTTLRIK